MSAPHNAVERVGDPDVGQRVFALVCQQRFGEASAAPTGFSLRAERRGFVRILQTDINAPPVAGKPRHAADTDVMAEKMPVPRHEFSLFRLLLKGNVFGVQLSVEQIKTGIDPQNHRRADMPTGMKGFSDSFCFTGVGGEIRSVFAVSSVQAVYLSINRLLCSGTVRRLNPAAHTELP